MGEWPQDGLRAKGIMGRAPFTSSIFSIDKNIAYISNVLLLLCPQTYVGDILVAINPFKQLTIYDKKVIYNSSHFVCSY